MNTKIVSLINLLFAAALSSCVVASHQGDDVEVQKSLYQISSTYDHKNMSFELKLISFADKKICMPKMAWPDPEGRHYLYGDRRVYIVDHDIRYDLKSLATGYCASNKKYGCVYRLRKNEVLIGRLPIEDFTVDSEIYSEEHFSPTLEYPYAPYSCP